MVSMMSFCLPNSDFHHLIVRVHPKEFSAEFEIEDVVVVAVAAVVDVAAVVVVVVVVVPVAVAGCHRLKMGSAFWVGVRKRVGATSQTSSGTS